jgi:hypothetical protein
VPADAQRTSEVDEAGTASLGSAQQRLEETLPLSDLTYFCKKSNRIKGCFQKIFFSLNLVKLEVILVAYKAQPQAPP